jgi:hypothetical protein
MDRTTPANNAASPRAAAAAPPRQCQRHRPYSLNRLRGLRNLVIVAGADSDLSRVPARDICGRRL